MSDPIVFLAEVVRVKTMADGGLRFEFGTGEDCIMQMAQLAECKRFGQVLKVTCEVVTLTDLDDETKKGAEGSGSQVDRRRSKNRRDSR